MTRQANYPPIATKVDFHPFQWFIPFLQNHWKPSLRHFYCILNSESTYTVYTVQEAFSL